MDWDVQSVRVTAFVQAYEPLRGLWAQLVGKEAEQIVDKPREASFAESGPRSEHQRLALSWFPGRAQLEVQPLGYPADLFAVLPSERDLMPHDFNELAAAWLGKLHDRRVHRIALGAVLLCEQPTRESTYESLQPLLPDLRLDTKSSDLMYRINRPRVSRRVDGLKLNRVSTWQAISLRQVLDDGSPMPHFTELAVAARLELDLSTDAERDQPLPFDQLSSLVDELVLAAREIATKGDIR